MNFKQLDYFVHVAELGSFSKAALVLNIAQPALSRQVRSLEVGLRETLLLRNGRGVVLTEAGQRLYEHGVNILQALALAQQDMGASRDAAVGRITIGLPPSVGRQLTLPLIDGFTRRLPLARLAIVEGLSSHISEWISTGRVDLGLLYNPEAQPALEITPVIEEALCLISPGAAPPGTDSTPKSQRRSQPRRHCRPRPRRAAAARAWALAVDRGRAQPRHPQAAGVASRAGRHQAQHCLGGVEHRGHHRSGVRRLRPRRAACQRRGRVGPGRADRLHARPLVQPRLNSMLCLAVSAHKRSTPLMRQATRLLTELVRALPQSRAVPSRPG